jgi:hypothetical protein
MPFLEEEETNEMAHETKQIKIWCAPGLQAKNEQNECVVECISLRSGLRGAPCSQATPVLCPPLQPRFMSLDQTKLLCRVYLSAL